MHEGSLRLIHQDYVSKFIALLVHASENLIHQKCLVFLMIDVYKYLNGLSSHIMNDIFRLIENTYNPIKFHLSETKILQQNNTV